MGDQSFDLVKLPPHSVEAEQSVLGGLLLENTAMDKIADILTEEDFYRQDHRLIYQHVCRIISQGKPADIVTASESLELSAKLQDVGGLAYLGALAQNTPSTANIRRYAEIVRERAIMRQLAEVGSSIADSAFNPMGKTPMELLNEAETKVFHIAEAGARSNQGFVAVQSLLPQVAERIDELSRNPSGMTGISTGFVDLDSKTSGLQRGDLIIVAGRPGMGKTALALNIAEHVALTNRLPVAVFSMEMTGVQLVTRMLSSIGNINHTKVRTGVFDDDDYPRLTEAMGRLNEAQISIDETPALNALDLLFRARRLHRQYHGLGLVVVDYLQLMAAANPGRNENRATEISEISRSLKTLAKELNVPVIALSQLNRGVEQRTDRRPVMSDLRESGAIEQDADLILMIYRDEEYNSDTKDKGIAEVSIAKQRNGPTGKFQLTFTRECTRFRNYADPGRY